MLRIAPTLVGSLFALAIVGLSGCADPGGGQAAGAGASDDDAVPTTAGPPESLSPVPGATTPAEPTTPADSGPPVPARLSGRVDDGAGNVVTTTLTCEPVGGDHPDAAGACAGIAAAGGAAAFAPADPSLACTEIYGGPQTATVTGTVNGAAVDASFSRANGCEIARWEALVALLGEAGAY